MIEKNILLLFLIVHIFFSGCQNANKQSDQNKKDLKTKNILNMEVKKTIFGEMDGKKIFAFTLTNPNGMKVKIIEFGAIVAEVIVPDNRSNLSDVVLGYDSLKGYQNDPYYFGTSIGRVANRIGGAKVTLDGTEYKLAPNTLPDFGYNSLHGGSKGFNKVFWKGEEFKNENEAGVKLTYLSPDGEEGYPGNVLCNVTYTLNNKNELGILFEATTDKKTFVNMTHHSYFNLAGEGNGDVLDTKILINADKYTPADDNLIPTGEIAAVEGLPVDFTSLRSINSQIDQMQMAKFKGYDLSYVLNHTQKVPGQQIQ